MQSAWTLLSWGPEGWLDDLAQGVFVTVSLALTTLPIGLFIGFFVAMAKQSSEPSLRLAGNIYTTIFRGLPELVTLFLVYFGAQLALQNLAHLYSPDATIEIIPGPKHFTPEESPSPIADAIQSLLKR